MCCPPWGWTQRLLTARFGRYNTKADVEDFILALQQGICTLAHR